MSKSFIYRLDWIVIFCYLILVFFGIINIYSSSYSQEMFYSSNFKSLVGKQVIFLLISISIGIFILGIRIQFFQQFSYTIYTISILSLIGLFIFGQTINGATSWYIFKGISIQPSEFAKIATAFMIAKHLSNFETNIKNKKSLIIGLCIIALPSSLIIIQPDPGSAVIFFSSFLVFFREGLSFNFLISLFFIFYLKKFNIKSKIFPLLLIVISSVIFVFSVNFIFNSVFEQRHRDRFNIILGVIEDTKGIGYNINQSKIAIGSGGLTGKGFLQGTQTKGNFVPEQQTDYIFSTVGEEWGFLGSLGLIMIFVILIVRMLNQAEKQTNIFRRTFIYSICSLIFSHFSINIGMSLGLLPTIGIPLPFISSGGSSLLTFSLLIFIYLNFDSNRLNDW